MDDSKTKRVEGETEVIDGEDARDRMDDGDEISPESDDGGDTSEIEQLREEIDALNDRHMRLAAEFDNYRRRAQSQLGEAALRAQAELVGQLLDVLDDFERVTSLDPEAVSVESLLEGVTMVERKLAGVLEEAGLEELEPAGDAFDPNVMEAMARVPAEAAEEDDIVDDVFQKGFRFGGHLVRPARVSVRKYES